MASLLERLEGAMNSHDPDAVSALFSPRYRSAQPAHPNRGFSGRDQVTVNWTAVFDGVPDFRAQLLAASVDGETEWGEWEWRGTHRDGSAFLMRGVIILRGREGLVADARLYMEPTEAGGAGIDGSLPELYGSGSGSEDGPG